MHFTDSVYNLEGTLLHLQICKLQQDEASRSFIKVGKKRKKKTTQHPFFLQLRNTRAQRTPGPQPVPGSEANPRCLCQQKSPPRICAHRRSGAMLLLTPGPRLAPASLPAPRPHPQQVPSPEGTSEATAPRVQNKNTPHSG